MTAATRPTDDAAALDDQALLAQVVNGDSRALDTLYDRYARVVYGMALRILGESELAEDVVQETFWRVWRRARTFQSNRGKVAAWIFGIAHNLSVDELRRQRSRPRSVYDTDATPVLRDREDSRMDVVADALENERGRLSVDVCSARVAATIRASSCCLTCAGGWRGAAAYGSVLSTP